MSKDEIFAHIQTATARILEDGGKDPFVINPDSPMWGSAGALDSLDLAVLVVELEGLTGKDPFKDGFINFRTAGELAALYVA